MKYKQRYPSVTIEEFLTETYLGAEMNNALFPSVREIAKEFLDVDSGKRRLFLSMGIGSGKSTLAFSVVIPFLVRNLISFTNLPALLNILDSEPLGFAFFSPDNKLGKEIIVDRIINTLEVLPFFQRVSYKKDVRYENNMIYYFAGSGTGSLSFLEMPNNIRFYLARDPTKLAGTLLTCLLSCLR